MNALNKVFFGIKPTWPKIVIFAVVAGVATGLIMMAPPLEGTFVRNIGETAEAWILFALIICANCEKPLEAALKTFVFFLISQPLVYLTMWPVYQSFPWHYYYYWFLATIACFPAGAAANYALKRGGIVGAIILAVPCALLAYMGAGFAESALRGAKSPDQLVAAVFCFAQIVAYVVVLEHGARNRAITGGLAAVAAVAYLVIALVGGPGSTLSYSVSTPGNYTVSVADASIVSAEMQTNSDLLVSAKGYGSTVITLTAADGATITYDVTVANDGLITLAERS